MTSEPLFERVYSLAEVRQALLLEDQYTMVLHHAQDLRVQLNEETYGSQLLAPVSHSPNLDNLNSYYNQLKSFTPLFEDECHQLEAILKDIDHLVCT